MQGAEFAEYFETFPHLKKCFKGVFAIDKLPKVLKLRQFCICNTDFAIGEGIHWFLLLKTNK